MVQNRDPILCDGYVPVNTPPPPPLPQRPGEMLDTGKDKKRVLYYQGIRQEGQIGEGCLTWASCVFPYFGRVA